MADVDVYKLFEEWFETDTAGDTEFSRLTAKEWLTWAENEGHIDEILSLRGRGMSMREWWSINYKPLASGNPFPDVRRKGGDHDRGFSPALNAEMRNRRKHEEHDDET